MAHLSGPDAGRPGGDRGQLLLVAVLVLAASFVVLALVVNSAIFAENLATREDVAGSEKALEYRAEVIDGVGQMVVAANEDSSLSTGSALESHTQSEIAILSARGGFSQALRGGVVDLSYQDATMGQRIAQDNPSRNLTGRNETADWRLAEDVDHLRNVRFTFPGPDSPGGPFFPSESDAFELVLEDSGADTWTLSFYGDVTVSVQRPDGTEAECTRSEPGPDEQLTVDVTGGTVDGEPCHALDRLSGGTEMWLGTGLGSSYDIEFENSDTVNGSYSMVIDNGNPDLSRLHSGHDPDEPYVTDALYGVELSYAYQNSAVAYEDTLVVRPGEVPP